MPVDDAVRVRVIRAMLGWNMKTLAEHLGVNHQTIHNWEDGKNIPNRKSRKVLSEICEQNKIAIRSDGFPVPSE